MRPRPPPVVVLAVSFGLGCAAVLSGALSPRALISTASVLLPILLLLRPNPRRGVDRTLLMALVLGGLAGAFRTDVWQGRAEGDCRLRVADGWSGEISGRFVAAARGGAVPFLVEGGLGSEQVPESDPGPEGASRAGPLPDVHCRGVVRSYPDRELDVRPGVRVRARATWRALPSRAWTTPETAGYLSLESIRPVEGGRDGSAAGPVARVRGRVLKVRGGAQERLQRLFGPVAPVTEALVLARKEGLDPELRDRFARAGVAHLLAISGFHVGIVAGILLLLGQMVGAGPRGAPLLASAGAWAYVLAIGSPDAAVRAAILLALFAVGPIRSRPLLPLGALGSAFLGFLLVDPGALGRVGFQLSFAGTAALILWSRGAARDMEALAGMVAGRLHRAWIRLRRGRPGLTAPGVEIGASRMRGTGAPRGRRRSGAARGLWSGIGAGIAATLGTLPLVAWHFGQVPLLGIPATLILGPLVALAIPGILVCLAVDLVAPSVAGFLAGGVGLLLEIVVRGSGVVAGIQGEAGWVSRWHVLAAGVGALSVWIVTRVARGVPPGWARRSLVGVGGVAGLLLAPVIGAPGTAGTVEIVAVDVGQGDALGIRSPEGRWILVDTGPRSRDFDAGARRVLPYLRRAGVDRIEALVLTHPDLDHIGGAPAILEGLDVGGVLDPGRVAAKGPFEDVLRTAREEGVPWWPAARRPSLQLDGLEIRVLHPSPDDRGSPAVLPALEDANEGSVVLLLTWGRFRALLTGDAPASVEEGVIEAIGGPVQLLKVGHHGSLTSTSRPFLEALRPEAAVISVGWRNRYGHPHPMVMDRLQGSGARIFRTDLHGTVVVRARDDGSWSASLPDAPGHIDPRAARAYR